MPPVHRTLPIPQVDPPVTHRAATEPSQGPVPTPDKKALKRMAKKNALRTPVYPRPQKTMGMDYGMNHKAEILNVNVPLPVRSSLAQTIGIFKVQLSHYFRSKAGATRYPGMLPDYPVAKVLTLINTAPRMRRGNPRNVVGERSPAFSFRSGYAARPGFMNAPPRFHKALPLPTNDYKPPIYGE